MDNLVEVPLGNTEVLKVLNAKNTEEHSEICKEMIFYLESVKIKEKYPMEILREIKGITNDIASLVSLSNTNHVDVVSLHDLKIINKYIKKV